MFVLLNGHMFMIDELRRIWKEAVMVYLHVNKFLIQDANCVRKGLDSSVYLMDLFLLVGVSCNMGLLLE